MKFSPDIPVFGDTAFRGKCPTETMEQVTFVRRVRDAYPETLGRLVVHPRNEELRQGRAFGKLSKDKAMGLSPGVADIILPGAPSFVCEMKRADHTKSKWQPGQVEYLLAAQAAGCYACVALGCDGAWEAFEAWQKNQARS